jgi:Ca-activated chloride channel family protein
MPASTAFSMPAPAGPVTRVQVPDGAGLVRTLATQEAARLRAAAQAPEYERRELLADLGTRLEAFAVVLGDGTQARAVRTLAAELAEEHLVGLGGEALAQLWDQVLALLDDLAAGQGRAGSGGGSSGGVRRADPGAFWTWR